jgi:defect-in-organelle-trafficking protein DotD
MYIRLLKCFLIMGMLCGLVACGKFTPQPLSSTKVIPTADGAMVQTAEAAASVSQSMESIASASRSDHGMLKRESGESPPEVLTRLMSIDWAGPVEPLAKQVALATQMRLKVLGATPAIPVIISMHKRDAMAYDVLEDMRAQVYPKVDILVFPVSGVIELRYL